MKKNITIRLVKSLKPADKPYEVLDTDIIGFLLRVHRHQDEAVLLGVQPGTAAGANW
jgi:hypothetical protein